MFKRRQLTIYRRTMLQMTLSILLIFSVLAAVYAFLLNISSIEQQENQLLTSAEALADRLEFALDENHLEILSPTARGDLMFAARSGGSLVWLVNSEGVIVYATSIPRETVEAFEKDPMGRIILSRALRHNTAFSSRAKVIKERFVPYLPAGEHWISATCALESPNGGYAGEIIVHRAHSVAANRFLNLDRSILIAFVVAFAVALIILTFLSRNITRPISALVQTADAVYRGDLSARVHIDGLADGNKQEEKLQSKTADDLSKLVLTFNTLISKFERQEAERQDFLSSISHDLRSPLTSIKGFVEGMLDGTIPPEKRDHYLEIVHQETRRLQGLVQNLMDVSTIQKTEPRKMAVFNLKDLIHEELDALEPQLNAKLLEVELSINIVDESEEGIKVIGDRDLIKRVFNNILNNGIRFTPEEGVIGIAVNSGTEHGQIRVDIEDSGPGIASKDLPYIFDRFYKANKARGSDGSGLGLYIARTALQAHGQTIEAGISGYGGARFSFTLQTPEGLV